MRSKMLIILVIFFSINSFSQSEKELYIINRNGKLGVIDNNFNIVVKPIYDDLIGYKGKYCIAKLNNKYGVIDFKGIQVLPFSYDYLGKTQSETKFIFMKNKKYGLINVKGKVLVKPEFDYISGLVNKGKSIIVYKNSKCALLKINGKNLTEYKYDYIGGDYNSKIYTYKINEKLGYLDKNGKEIINGTYEQTYKFYGKYAIVKFNKKFAVINRKGKFILPPIYDKISYRYSFNSNYQARNLEQVYYVKKNGKIGLFDKDLKIITPFLYDEIGDFNDGYAYVVKNKKYGFINIKGKLTIPLMYENAYCFSEGLAPVIKNGKWGFIDKLNNVVIDFKFTGNVKPFFEGMAIYRKRNYNSSKAHYVGDKVGYINYEGNVVIKPIYRNGERFSKKGVAIVEDNNFKYLIDKKNNKVVLKNSEPEVIGVCE